VRAAQAVEDLLHLRPRDRNCHSSTGPALRGRRPSPRDSICVGHRAGIEKRAPHAGTGADTEDGGRPERFEAAIDRFKGDWGAAGGPLEGLASRVPSAVRPTQRALCTPALAYRVRRPRGWPTSFVTDDAATERPQCDPALSVPESQSSARTQTIETGVHDPVDADGGDLDGLARARTGRHPVSDQPSSWSTSEAAAALHGGNRVWDVEKGKTTYRQPGAGRGGLQAVIR